MGLQTFSFNVSDPPPYRHQLYSKEDLLQAKFELLSKTKMIDYANVVYQEIHGLEGSEENMPDYDERRNEALGRLEELQEESAQIMQMIQDPVVIQQLKQDKLANVLFLTQNFDFKPEMLDSLYEFATFNYAVGNYTAAAEMLYHFRILSTDFELNASALWGKLGSEMLTQNWDTALDDLTKLKELLDQRSFTSHSHALQQRSWLIHWSLFVFFNHPKGRDGIIDMFFQPQYLNTIQNSCPWILRYLATAVVINRKRRNMLKDLVKLVQAQSHIYQDPITEFIECLYVHFDFDGAQRKLKECEDVLGNDFFLVAVRDEFIENARLFIFETYCRIHQCIDIKGLSEKLNMDEHEGEKWIVNLIRNAKMDAKIDAKTNTVVMGTQYQSVYQQVIERTRALSFRSSLLASNIEKRELELANRRKGRGGQVKEGSKPQQQQAQAAVVEAQ
ncbi:eIF3 subunit 6 N terminal domain-containing protein [Blyttiomyces helicus]|uniref:Eukaryotic translation initiation factor 3 subunit E n=1 Tax=Blyttiomyces helicus TaxID=388810 RepID=A0A4P9VWF8_9FUNG|nr:eIF3 subunit 6 N terminal domain-containing protein [Blyttiomyces helicus]|eukprot:RKO83185.1 eIF3 subunit 6 N terminal domain-containing protein [Blyttiomyces helicus]